MNNSITSFLSRLTHSGKKSFIFLFASLFFLCNSILLSLASSVYYHSTENVILDSVYQYTYTIMNQTHFGFNQYMSFDKDALSSLALNDNIISAYQCYENNNIPSLALYEKRLAESIKNTIKYRPEIIDIIIITDNGFVTNKDTRNSLSSPNHMNHMTWYLIGLDYGRNDPINIFRTTLDFYKVYVPNYNAPVIGISHPIYDYLQRKIGTVTIFMDSNMLALLAFNSDCTKYGDLYFVDSHHDYLMGTSGEEMFQPSILEGALNTTGTTDTAFDSEPSTLLINSEVYDCSILYLINLNISEETKVLRFNIFLIFFICILLNLILAVCLYLRASKPVNLLVSDIQNANSADYLHLKGDYRYRELNIIASSFNSLMDNLQMLNAAKIETELSLQKERNSLLLSKLNPHFLFNALQLIQTESMYGSKENTNKIILSLSNQLRYNIYEENEMVPLSKELERTIEYLQLTKTIYEDRFDYRVSIQKELLKYLIPRFTLHILVENSIKHGFENMPSHNHIQISGYQLGEQMVLTVKDDGKGIPEEKLDCINNSLSDGTFQGIGLHSLTQQLKLLYGEEYNISIFSDSTGTTVVVPFPCTPQ